MTNWRRLADIASGMVGTPCYVMSEPNLLGALARLRALESSLLLRHWVSLKTQPVARLVKAAIDLDLGIDVVSEYELAGALGAGVPGNRILVNGVAKNSWLQSTRTPHLSVHFDSLAEVHGLAAIAKVLNWRVGLRCAIPQRGDAVNNQRALCRDQFGMTRDELQAAMVILEKVGVAIDGLHFHLHTNIMRVSDYRDALEHVAEAAEDLRLEPEYVDIGGGIPIAGETLIDGTSTAGAFDFAEFRQMLGRIPLALPSIREVWMENGRFLTGPAGALVVTVLDKKVRSDVTYLICDGGRVNHARMASTERHEVLLAPNRTAPLQKTVVCGPTCTAVDRLGGWMLPEAIEPGDRIIWLTAGAYHIPLETRFSTGLAPVVWFNARQEPEVIRSRETPAEWWGQWVSPEAEPIALVG